VFAEYKWPGADQPLVRVALSDAEQAKFVGRFLVGATPFEIVRRDGRLMGHPPFEELVELVPVAADRVVERDGGTELRLRADGGLDFAPKRGAVQHAARSDVHYLWLIADGKLAEAAELLRQAPRPRDEESRVNNLGYRLMVDDAKSAVAVLSMNATAFPDSANAHDSLGEAYATAGDVANAIAAYRRAAATVDADDRIEAERKAEFRKRVDEQLAKLEHR
jgi:hypothetical protein